MPHIRMDKERSKAHERQDAAPQHKTPHPTRSKK